MVTEILRKKEHIKALSKLQTVTQKIEYAYDLGYTTRHTINEFLVSNDINNILLSTISTLLDRIKKGKTPINKALRKKEHIEALSKLRTAQRKVQYTYNLGYITRKAINEFLISNDINILLSTISTLLDRIKISKIPINKALRKKEHIDALSKLKTNVQKIQYAYNLGYVHQKTINEFLVSNDNIVSYSVIVTILYLVRRGMLSTIINTVPPINKTLRKKEYIDVLSKLKTVREKVQYAYDLGCANEFEVNEFLVSNDNYIVYPKLNRECLIIKLSKIPINKTLRKKEHIEALSKLKIIKEKVQYAYDLGYTTRYAINEFLISNDNYVLYDTLGISLRRIRKAIEEGKKSYRD